MKKILKDAKKSKKSRVLGEPQVISASDYEKMEVDAKAETIKALIPLGLMCVSEMLEAEIDDLVGTRYSRGEGASNLVRYGKNNSSVKLGGQRHPVHVPRVRNQALKEEVPLQGWKELKKTGTGEINEILLNRVLHGISCRNYQKAAEDVPGAIGLSSSTVSRKFVEASAEKLKELNERDLSEHDIVVIFLDGKTFADDTMIVALGVTLTGEKVLLGFVQAGTENGKVITEFLEELRDRGLRIEDGILVVIDGSKGLIAGVKKAFKDRVLIQRCQWHKRENVVSYLPKSEQKKMRNQLILAHQKPTYAEANNALMKIQRKLEDTNLSAARSLEEGLEETLTLHRLGIYELLGKSLKTTNCLESINSRIEACCRKVTYWKNSSQKQRWLATALLDIEPRLNRISGYKHLSILRERIQEELDLKMKSAVV